MGEPAGGTDASDIVDPGTLGWAESPAPGVWRKRFHGAGEDAAATSLVRFDPGAAFPHHGHPDGEEILVLAGVFSDEAGHHGPGTYLLNPEGSSHAPFSDTGCTIFVKLRQYQGQRPQAAMDTTGMPWQPAERPGVRERLLYEAPEHGERVSLERWRADAGGRSFDRPAEILVLDGTVRTGAREAGPLCRILLPEGVQISPGAKGATLYLRLDRKAGPPPVRPA